MNVPKQEYPRPSFVRNFGWVNLNGEWQFEIDHSDTGKQRRFQDREKLDGKIIVPYCPESVLSGIGYKDFMKAVWYKREFDVPSEWNDGRVLLHFGACDYRTEVWVNGKYLGRHYGGYTPFCFDITDIASRTDSNKVVVYAFDDTRDPLQPTGKQDIVYQNEFYCWYYARTTGIWQTVWLEYLPYTYVENFKITPDVDNKNIAVRVSLNQPVDNSELKTTVSYKGRELCIKKVSIDGKYAEFTVEIPEMHLWNPGKAELYDIVFEVGKDKVTSYFAMRKVAVKGYAIEINDVPVFQRLVLDQCFCGEGIYTAPDGDYYKRDIEYALEAGFNGARLHEKIVEPYYLYWADRLGYLVWGEYPNYHWNCSSPAALYHMLPEWLEAVERDYNHPSIVGWCPVNEGTAERIDRNYILLYDVTRAIDPMRPIIDTSGWVHAKTDIFDSHDYSRLPEFAQHYESLKTGEGEVYISMGWGKVPSVPYEGQPYFISEWGAFSVDIISHEPTEEEFERFYTDYKAKVDVMMDNPKMCAFCYCQWCDSAEHERNGFITEDRRKKYDFARTREIMSRKAAIEK